MIQLMTRAFTLITLNHDRKVTREMTKMKMRPRALRPNGHVLSIRNMSVSENNRGIRRTARLRDMRTGVCQNKIGDENSSSQATNNVNTINIPTETSTNARAIFRQSGRHRMTAAPNGTGRSTAPAFCLLRIERANEDPAITRRQTDTRSLE